MDRRHFLRLTGAGVVIVVLGTGCTDSDSSSSASLTDTTADNMPELYNDEVNFLVNPIRRLMKPADRNFGIKIEVNGKNYVDGQAHDISAKHKEIHIGLPSVTQESLEAGRQAAIHEVTHMFNFSHEWAPQRYIEGEMKKRVGRKKYSDNEVDIFRESSYSDHPAWKRMGHPQDGFDELLASTITVCWSRPTELIDRITALEDEKQKIFVATSALVCIDSLIKFSSVPTNYSDLPFNPALVRYLQATGRTA